MYDPNFNLTPEPQQPKPRSGWGAKAALAAAIVGVMVLAALYAPLLWQQTSAFAQSATAAVTAEPVKLPDNTLAQDQDALAALYEQISPSVVSIAVESTSTAGDLQGIPGFQLPQDNLPQRGEGSGWIYDNDGHIVTNNHVVEGATKVVVNFANGYWAKAEVVATDPQADVAVIKVDKPAGMDWRPLTLADDGSLKVGHTVVAIGNPFGFENTMTTGIVSALGRSFPTGSFGANRYSLPDVIQTDAAINPGNSGGPLLDLNGNVVGINFAIESGAGSNAGVGFAIPASIVKRVVPELIQNGKVQYAYLGIEGNTISADVADVLGLPQNQLGAYVANVVTGGPADKAGIKGGTQTVTTSTGAEVQKGGDIITAIDGQPVTRFEDMVSYLVTKANPGQEVTLTVLRDGKTQEIKVTLGERPSQPVASSSQQGGQGNGDQGDQGQQIPGLPNLPGLPGQGEQGQGQQGSLNARAAIAIAEPAAQKAGLTGDITEKVATPDTQDGKSVWVVELSTADKQATVTVDATSGDVLDVQVK